MLLFSALCFLVILLAQISEKTPYEPALGEQESSRTHANDNKGATEAETEGKNKNFYVDILDMDLFPGPHSEKRNRNKDKYLVHEGAKRFTK